MCARGRIPFYLKWSIGFPSFWSDQYYSDQKEGNILETAKTEAVWGHWDRWTYFWSKIEADEGHWCRVPFFLKWSIGFPSFWSDQYYSDQKEGNISETAKKEAVWGHWEVIGIGEPIFDQKLRPIVAEEVIKILFPCFWSDAINSCENPKSKKYKKNLKSWDILPLLQSAVDWSQLLTFSAACVALQHMQLCVPSILSVTSGKPEVPCFLNIATKLTLKKFTYSVQCLNVFIVAAIVF